MTVEYKPKILGQAAEDAACTFLQTQGLSLLQKNFRCSCGEIDLIMQDRDELIFVEVRLRHHSGHGNSLESINQQKQRKIIKAALFYLQKKKLFDKVFCRFDVIGLDTNQKLSWVKNAFSADFV